MIFSEKTSQEIDNVLNHFTFVVATVMVVATIGKCN